MDSLGTRRPVIPMLTHVDNLSDIKTDLTGQQKILSDIKENTKDTTDRLFSLEHGLLQRIYENGVTINLDVSEIGVSANSIKTSSSNTATATSSLYSSVGTTADASTENTVIGLLKSIVNKLS